MKLTDPKKGQFNLDFEDSLLLRGRLNKLISVLQRISSLARTLLVFVRGQGMADKLTQKIIRLTDEYKKEE